MTLADETRLRRAADAALGKRIDALEARVLELEGPVIEPPPVEPPPSPPPPIPASGYVGFGAKVTGGAGKQIVHVTNLNDAGSGSFRAALGSDRTIVFDVVGEIALQSKIALGGLANLTVDATGKQVTLTRYGVDLSGIRNVLWRNTASRNLLPIQYASGLTFRNGSTQFYVDHFSADGYSHRGLDIWTDCTDWTVAWPLIGPKGPQGLSNYPFLAGEGSLRGSLDHYLFVNGETRMPQFHYRDGQIAPDTTGDAANGLAWSTDPNYYSLMTAHGGAKVNVRNSYFYSSTGTTFNRAIHSEGGASVFQEGCFGKNVDLTTANPAASPFAVPSYAVLPLEASALAAAQAVLAGAGRFPRDAVDAGYVAKVTL